MQDDDGGSEAHFDEQLHTVSVTSPGTILLSVMAAFEGLELTSPPAERQGIPGLLTAESASRASRTRAVAPGVSPPLHRRRFPQALRSADTSAHRKETALPPRASRRGSPRRKPMNKRQKASKPLASETPRRVSEQSAATEGRYLLLANLANVEYTLC